ncbi:MAG: Asp-tRNA(Asn)/Glu-tRNA(Gln) amidotransferase subunit GatC [Thermoanaerobaculia bacterium]
MNITRDEARRIAALAHLELDDPALDRMAADMTEILGYIEQLQVVDAGRADSSEEAALLASEDVPRESVGRDLVAANAPAFRDGFFVVPRVVGGDE